MRVSGSSRPTACCSRSARSRSYRTTATDFRGYAEYITTDRFLLSHLGPASPGPHSPSYLIALLSFIARGRGVTAAIVGTALTVIGNVGNIALFGVAAFAQPAIGRAYLDGREAVPAVNDDVYGTPLFATAGIAILCFTAFPGCSHPLIDAHGNFVSELCHIEAAEPGGPRFNPKLTNEQRRDRDNLLLMCHRHHVETDDAETWTVERMQGIKASHEREFEEAITRIAESTISDITKAVEVGQPKSLQRFGLVMSEAGEWTLSPDELLGSLDHAVLPMLDRLRGLAPDTRSVFLIVIERGEDYGSDLGLPMHEAEQVTGLGSDVLWPHIDTLTRYELASIDEDFDGRRWVVTHDLDGWPFWRDLKKYCMATGLALSAFLIDLRFDLLD